MKSSIIYIHGNGGSAKEASHYQSFFADADVIGFDYKAKSPWEAKKEFSPYFERLHIRDDYSKQYWRVFCHARFIRYADRNGKANALP